MKRHRVTPMLFCLAAFSCLGAKSGYGLEPGAGGSSSSLAGVGSLAGDVAACAAAVRAAERKANLPPSLLGAISLAESGRTEPRTNHFGAWPWTINVAGRDYFFDTKQAAIAAVLQSQAMGVRSIDVGCMQVNLMHHPDAFASLDHAFDPWANADYAAGFLGRLRVLTGNWASATAAYHSMTPELGAEYQSHVAAFLPAGSRYGLSVQPMNAMLMEPRLPPVDPYNVMTPEFKARLRQDTTDRMARNSALGLPHATSALRPTSIPAWTAKRGAPPPMRQAHATARTRVS